MGTEVPEAPAHKALQNLQETHVVILCPGSHGFPEQEGTVTSAAADAADNSPGWWL